METKIIKFAYKICCIGAILLIVVSCSKSLNYLDKMAQQQVIYNNSINF